MYIGMGIGTGGHWGHVPPKFRSVPHPLLCPVLQINFIKNYIPPNQLDVGSIAAKIWNICLQRHAVLFD